MTTSFLSSHGLRSALTVLRFIWNHPANREAPMAAVVRAVSWQLYKRLTGSYRDVRLPTGACFRVYPDSTSGSALIYFSGWPDYDEMMFLKAFLRPGDTFADVGANVGVYTVLAATLVGSSGRILAFEPDPGSAERLQENVRLNEFGHVTVHRVAASDTAGTVSFLANRDSVNRLAPQEGNDEPTIEVPVTCLDKELQGLNVIMGKMDIEGAEPMALRGAERLIKQQNPAVWQLEINGALRVYGFSEEALRDWLEQRGYVLVLFDARQQTLTVCREPWKLRDNCLAIAASKLDWVCTRLIEAGQPCVLSRG